MSYIFPAGTKKTDWISEMAKTAKKDSDIKKAQMIETEEIDVIPEETLEEDKGFQDFQKDVALEGDSAFDAIKDLPGIKEKADKLLDELKTQVEEVVQKVEEVSQTVKEEEKSEVEETPAEEAKEEKSEDKSENKEEIKEVELEITDDDDDKKEIEVSIEPENKDEMTDVGPEGIKKEGEDDFVEAQSNGFVKIAKISPKNRAALKEYWLALGFPGEYVEAMVKDY